MIASDCVGKKRRIGYRDERLLSIRVDEKIWVLKSAGVKATWLAVQIRTTGRQERVPFISTLCLLDIERSEYQHGSKHSFCHTIHNTISRVQKEGHNRDGNTLAKQVK